LIEEIDFFDINPTAYYDVVVCSMVINCVPLAQKRGEMLARLSAHLGSNGILFLVLPSRCINSPEIGGVKVFSELLLDCGLTEVNDPNLENKTSPKLTFFILKNTADFVELKEKSLNSSSGDGSSLILKKMLDKSKANIKTRNIEYQDKFILFNNKEKKKNQISKNFDIKFV
jgi:25S rRNA (adenine2142-N1)-methyltransferase